MVLLCYCWLHVSYRSYKAGDVVMIKPQNSAEVVQEFISLLQLDGDAVFALRQNDQGVVDHSLSCACVRHAILCYTNDAYLYAVL